MMTVSKVGFDYSAHIDPLLNLIANLIETSTNETITSGNEWKGLVHPLAHKLFRHIMSVCILSEKVTIETNSGVGKIEFIDHSSVNVLVRAVLETYIVFHYLTSGPTNDENEFRVMTWQMCGLMDRQKLSANFRETMARQAQEKSDIAILKHRIEEHASFSALPADKQKLLMKGDWSYRTPWHQLATDADIEEIVFTNVYNHLCGQAHSSYISALQLLCAKTEEDQQFLATGMLPVVLKVMAHFIQAFVRFCPSTQCVLDAYPDAAKIADLHRTTSDEIRRAREENRLSEQNKA